MDIGKEVKEVEFEPLAPPVSVPGPDPVHVPVPMVPIPAPEPVHSDPAPDKEPAHAAAVQLLHR